MHIHAYCNVNLLRLAGLGNEAKDTFHLIHGQCFFHAIFLGEGRFATKIYLHLPPLDHALLTSPSRR